MAQGLGSGFAPSIAAAQKALGASTVETRVHPGGPQGSKVSLEETAKRVWEGRNDPRVRAWAGKAIIAAGRPTEPKAQTQAILDALRKQTMYLPDPVNTELIAKPHVTLCLDDHGLCLPAADCFPEGTLLLRDDYELVPIEQIKPGDRIWGRDAWTTVQAKAYKGLLPVEGIFLNNGSTVYLTPDHHVYVARCDRHVNRTVTPPCACPIDERRIERIKVSELEPKDVLIQPKRIEFGAAFGDNDRAWVEGVYVADGWSSNNTNFCISGKDGFPKEAQKKRVESICKRLGFHTRWHERYIAVHDREWTLRMHQMGTHAVFKHLLSLNLDEAAAAETLRGVMADSGANTNGSGRTFTTTSFALMVQVRVLHRMFGVSTSVRYMTPEQHQGAGQHPIWRVGVRAPKEQHDKILRVKSVEHEVAELPCYDIQTEDHYVYLPEHDVTVSNCDDLCVALGAAALSVGIPVLVIGQAFGTEAAASHVIIAIDGVNHQKFPQAQAQWVKVDPSGKDYPVGRSVPAVREWWIDPSDPSGMRERRGMGAIMNGSGDFVGVGAIPWMGMRAYACDPPPGWHPEGPVTHPAGPGVGEIPWMGLRAFGLGQGVNASGGLVKGAYDALTSQIQGLVFGLEQRRNLLGAALQKIATTRLATQPNSPFDPEPSTPITSLADFPETGIWTQSMDAVATQTYDVADRLVGYGHQVLAGARKLLVDPKTTDAYVEMKPTDPWGIHAVVQTAEDLIFGFFDQAGNLLSGLDAKTGAALTAAQVQQAAQAVQGGGPPQAQRGTGQGPAIVPEVISVVGIAVVGIGLYYLFARYCDMAATKANAAVDQSIVACIQSGQCPANMLDVAQKNRIADKQADAANKKEDPFASAIASLGTAIMWAAIGGIGVAGIVTVAPVVRDALERRRALPAKTASTKPNPLRRRRHHR